jgi:hypothetical protein
VDAQAGGVVTFRCPPSVDEILYETELSSKIATGVLHGLDKLLYGSPALCSAAAWLVLGMVTILVRRESQVVVQAYNNKRFHTTNPANPWPGKPLLNSGIDNPVLGSRVGSSW